ncbi:MAG: hypothetical protein WA828_09300 [Coleofasciculaceae cyanobacterium]
MLTSYPVLFSATLLILATVSSAQSTASIADIPTSLQIETSNNSKISQQTKTSELATMALAKHLKQLDAKFYGAFWCPYCTRQKKMFGEQAFRQINYIECDARGNNPQPKLCIKAGISGYPTWEIKGKQYRGMKTLKELADLSGYQGDRNFGNE